MSLELTFFADATLDDAQAKRAEEEVAWALRVISEHASPQVPTLATSLEILVVEDFGAAVRAAERELTGFEALRPERELVVPVGQHLAVGGANGMRCVVVVYAGFWRHETTEAIVSRLVTAMHEFGHFVLARQRLASGVTQPQGESFERALARQLWEECAVDTLVDVALRRSRAFTDGAGTALGLRETQIEGLMHSARGLLPIFRDWVARRVQHYRVTGEGLELLLPEFRALQTELFTVLAHLVGAFRGHGVEDLRERLESAEGFVEYLSGTWTAFVDAICAEETAAAELLVGCLNGFSRDAGLTHEAGYLRVGRPNGFPE